MAYVYDELQNMFDAVAPDQIIARGMGWSSIVSGDTSKGSRLEKSSGSTVSVWHNERRDGPRENHVNKELSWRTHQRELRIVVPSAERSAERSMTLYGQMSNKGWSRHQRSQVRRCKRSVGFGGLTYFWHCFFRKSTQSLSPLGASAYEVQ